MLTNQVRIVTWKDPMARIRVARIRFGPFSASRHYTKNNLRSNNFSQEELMKPLLTHAIFRSTAIIVTLLFCSQSSYAQMGKVDTSFVSDDAFFVIRVDVEKLVGQVPMGSKDLEMLAKPLKEEGGLDLMNMTAITMQFGKLDGGPFDSAFSVTFENAKKIDRDSFHSAGEFALEDYTETEYAGKTYLRHRRDGGPHLYFSNEKTFTMATSKGMESLLKAGSGMGTMSSLIKSAPPSSEIMLAFRSNEGYDGFLNQFFDSMGPIGLPFEPKDLLANAKSGFGHLQLASSTPIYIQTTCDSNESAAAMKKALDQLVEMGKSALPVGNMMVESQLKELGDGGFAEMQKSMFKLAKDGLKTGGKILDGVDVNVAKKTMTLKVKHMGGLKELVPLAVGGMKAMFLGISSESLDEEFLELDEAVEAVPDDGK